MTSRTYGEGDWFAVPLAGGDFAAALADVADLRPRDAVLVGICGHLALRSGEWPIVGRAASWDRDTWAMPVFVRTEEVSGRSFRVFYDPDDPSRHLRDERIPPSTAVQGPGDGLMGAAYVEERLALVLA